ncbi:hypothetical protein [Blastococcus sp. CT_GayMR19]|uniref:hypothetical protein n=1 Tax=Blastococcus sp. CT_GayMR19 TaxID=2559608 RepID=UPI001FD835D3|nr:hypothetical protein [Blastococcus sp. CT_GayMR19]
MKVMPGGDPPGDRHAATEHQTGETRVGISQRMGTAELMQIDKEQVMELLRSKGEADKVEQADRELPDRMDTDDDVDLLSRYGLGPQEVIAKLGGGPLGGLTGR